jgi:hypothetical protein
MSPTSSPLSLTLSHSLSVTLTHSLSTQQEVPIDSRWKEAFQEAYEALGGMGERVLGFAELYLDEQLYGPDYDKKYNPEEKNFPMVCPLLSPFFYFYFIFYLFFPTLYPSLFIY